MKASKKSRITVLTLGICAVLCAPLLTGCSKNMGTSSSVSSQEAKNFKGGGPMPAEAQREIAKRMQMNQQRMQQGGQTPPASAGGASQQR